jgi:NADH dehydrogenase
VVDELLRVVDVPGVWALGDRAAVPNQATPGATDPATCQHALRQARRLARNLPGAPRPYGYRTRGQMATLGRRHGIAVVAGLRVRGLAGWAIARGYHLLQLPFIARRARVLADWTAAALFHRDVAELSPCQRRGDNLMAKMRHDKPASSDDQCPGKGMLSVVGT